MTFSDSEAIFASETAEHRELHKKKKKNVTKRQGKAKTATDLRYSRASILLLLKNRGYKETWSLRNGASRKLSRNKN